MPPDRVWYPRCRSIAPKIFWDAHRGGKEPGTGQVRHGAAQMKNKKNKKCPTRYKSGTLKRARSNCDHAAESRLSCEPVLNRPDISEH
jgi:hypothetical protein